MTKDQIRLVKAERGDFPKFKSELQEAFAIAVVEEFGSLPNGPIPSDADLNNTMCAADAVVLRILCANQPVGGAVLSIDPETHHNALGLFFLNPSEHGRGVGHKAWQAIERLYPETRVWTTHTPYFEKRNIHFYVNKCGFKIVRFYNAHLPDPHGPGANDLPGRNEGFAFEKIMNVGLDKALLHWPGSARTRHAHQFAVDLLFSQRPLSAAGEQRWDIQNSIRASKVSARGTLAGSSAPREPSNPSKSGPFGSGLIGKVGYVTAPCSIWQSAASCAAATS